MGSDRIQENLSKKDEVNINVKDGVKQELQFDQYGDGEKGLEKIKSRQSQGRGKGKEGAGMVGVDDLSIPAGPPKLRIIMDSKAMAQADDFPNNSPEDGLETDEIDEDLSAGYMGSSGQLNSAEKQIRKDIIDQKALEK
jgi:hypothetical protein